VVPEDGWFRGFSVFVQATGPAISQGLVVASELTSAVAKGAAASWSLSLLPASRGRESVPHMQRRWRNLMRRAAEDWQGPSLSIAGRHETLEASDF